MPQITAGLGRFDRMQIGRRQLRPFPALNAQTISLVLHWWPDRQGRCGMQRVNRTVAAILCLLLAVAWSAVHAQETVTVDAQATATPLPHFWEQMFGSGHANLAMREAYRNDLTAVKNVTDMKYVRFHGILA